MSEGGWPLRVLVTGGRGKVGARTTERLLEAGHEAMVTDMTPSRYGAAGLSPAPYVRADLSDFGQTVAVVAKARPDVVIHAAGIPETNHDPQSVIFANNVLSTFHICEAVSLLGVPRVVYLSSESAAGFVTAVPAAMPDYVPVDENHPVRPHEAYAMSKYLGEVIADALVRRSGASAVSIRATFVVGREDYTGLLKTIREAPPRPFDNLWSYVDVDDLADLVVLAATANTAGHEMVYAAQPDNFMGLPLRELIAEVYGDKAPPIGDLPRPDASAISSAKAMALFGWRPSRSWRV